MGRYGRFLKVVLLALALTMLSCSDDAEVVHQPKAAAPVQQPKPAPPAKAGPETFEALMMAWQKCTTTVQKKVYLQGLEGRRIKWAGVVAEVHENRGGKGYTGCIAVAQLHQQFGRAIISSAELRVSLGFEEALALNQGDVVLCEGVLDQVNIGRVGIDPMSPYAKVLVTLDDAALTVMQTAAERRDREFRAQEQQKAHEEILAAFTYAEWAQELDDMIQNESPEGVDTVGPMGQVTIFEPTNRQNIRFDPFSGEALRDAGWVTDASVDAKGNWRIDIDIDAPGTAADGAEIHLVVHQRYTSGNPPPASGTKLTFYGAIQEWEYHKGHRTQVWLKDVSIADPL